MAEIELAFLLPVPGWPRAVFASPFGYDGGELLLDGAVVVRAHTRTELERGVTAALAGGGPPVTLRLVAEARRAPRVEVTVADEPARREDRLRARPTPSAWIHATIALAASAAGFAASWLYLLRAATEANDWALKMGRHMAGWHLLLTLTLFPASVWGQRVGIRAVQLVSLLFFAIHAGIAIANAGDDGAAHEGAIALLNALSGACFLAAALFGNRAHRDMDPVRALRAGRA